MSSISWTKRPGGSRPSADWLQKKNDNDVRPAFAEDPVEAVSPIDEVGAPQRDSVAPGSYGLPSRPPVGRVPAQDPAPQAAIPEPPPPAEPPPELIAELERYLVALDSSLKQLEAARRQMGRQAAEQAVEIGLAVAEELASGAIEVEPSRVLDIAGEAVEAMAGDGPVDVRVMPEIYRLLLDNGFLEGFADGSRMSLRPDPSVGDLGCIVDGAYGRVDGRVKSRLARLRHLLDQGAGVVEEEDDR